MKRIFRAMVVGAAALSCAARAETPAAVAKARELGWLA